MNIDYGLYNVNPFYRQYIDRLLEYERECQELQRQLDNRRRAMMVDYINQMPFRRMTPLSPYVWQASYPTFENNYTNYWGGQYPMHQRQLEEQYRQNFKNAIDAAAKMSENSNPVVSIVFDGIGVMTADNLFEAAVKAVSIIDKASKL